MSQPLGEAWEPPLPLWSFTLFLRSGQVFIATCWPLKKRLGLGAEWSLTGKDRMNAKAGGLGWTGLVILGIIPRWAGYDEGLKKGRSGPGMRRDASTSSALGWSGAQSLSGLSGCV